MTARDGTTSSDRRAYRLTGRVQGVGFRWWTRRTGQSLGLIGTVRNASDGSVEIHAAGDPKALDDLEERLRNGPPHARVDRVDAMDWSLDALPDDFQIAR